MPMIWMTLMKVETMEYPMTYLLSSEQDLFLNKWKLRLCYKYNLFDKIPDGEEKEQEKANSGGQWRQVVLQEFWGMR